MTKELTVIPAGLRPHSLLFVGIVDLTLMGDDGLADVIGYVAEDEIDEAMTVMVGLEGQPLRLEELISQTRRFRLVVGGERVGFAEWRGIGIPTE